MTTNAERAAQVAAEPWALGRSYHEVWRGGLCMAFNWLLASPQRGKAGSACASKQTATLFARN